MPEPVITLISGVAAIVTNVWKVSKDLYDLIEGIRNAPNHVRVIMADVHGLYIVLGALQGVLPNVDAKRLRTDLIPIFESLQLNLNNCCSILVELSRKLNRYTNAAGEISKSKWMAFRWQFTEKDVKDFRDHLSAYKMTVQLAISTANLNLDLTQPSANSTQNIGNNERIGTEMEQMRAKVDQIAFNQDLLGRSDAGDHGSVSTDDTDGDFALKRFLMNTESAFSGSPPGSPGKTGNREGSVSPSPTTIKAQPAHIKRDLESIKGRRNNGPGSVSGTNPNTWKTESRDLEWIRGGRMKASTVKSHQSFLSEDDLEVSQHTPDQEIRRDLYEDRPTPDDAMRSLSTMHESDSLIQQADGRSYDLELKGNQQGRERQYRRQEKNVPDLDAFYTSRLSLAREYTLLDHDGDNHQSYRLTPSARSSNSSTAFREPKSTANPVHAPASLSPIQESYPSGIPSYASPDEDHAGKSQALSLSREEYPFLTTENNALAPDIEEARKIKTADIHSQMDHLTVQEAQRTAARNEKKILSVGVLGAAARPEFRREPEQGARYASHPRLKLWNDDDSWQKSREALEALKRISEPISLPLSDSPLGYSHGDELSNATYRDIQQRHPFDDNFGETKVVHERSSDTGYHALAGSEQTGKFQDRIHPGDDFDSKGAELSPYSLPKDGSPVTLATRHRKRNRTESTNKSQTSLLLEYFEGVKGSQVEYRRPSVRVKVTPSSKSRKRSSNDHIQITEQGLRKPSYTNEILLSPEKSAKAPAEDGDDKNIAQPYRSAAEAPIPTSRRGSPIEAEIVPGRARIPSMQPEIASSRTHKPDKRSGSHEDQHPPSTFDILPTLQEDVQEDIAEKPTGEAFTHGPEIAARKRPTSKSSINNPKLLETVEDAIRRLILPELTMLKREAGKKKRWEDKLVANNLNDDAPSSRRREHQSKARDQDATDSSPMPPIPGINQTETLEIFLPSLPTVTESDIGRDVTPMQAEYTPVAIQEFWRRKQDVAEDQSSTAKHRKSQDDLLIEYFEPPHHAGKKPSFRIRVGKKDAENGGSEAIKTVEIPEGKVL